MPSYPTAQNEIDDSEIDRLIDLFHEGYAAFLAGRPMPADPEQASGWRDAQRASLVRVVMPRRPEGYYHMPLGTFD